MQQVAQSRHTDLIPFGIYATTPPPTDGGEVMQRADEVNMVLRLLNDPQISTVVLGGDAGAGKSTLAALLFSRLQTVAQRGLPAPRHLVWLGLGPHTTLPDIIAAILSALHMSDPAFFFLKPEQQISQLLLALRRPQEPALIVLDAFDELLNYEENAITIKAERGAILLLLDMLQTDLGASRVLLTCLRSPFPSNLEVEVEIRVRSYLVSRMSIPEGIALLQQRGVQGSPAELSPTWQRCAGHAFALVLCSTLTLLTGAPLGYLLNAPDCLSLWNGHVPLNLLAAIYHRLNVVQRNLLRGLCLFDEPVPLQALSMTMLNEGYDSVQADLPTLEQALRLLVRMALVQVRLDQSGTPCYDMHLLLRLYTLENYLEGVDRRAIESGPLNPPTNTIEAQQAALAAGHMRVAGYYQQRAQQQNIPRTQRSGPADVEPLISAIRHLCRGQHWQQACDLLFTEGLHESMVMWGAWHTLIDLYTAMLPPQGVLAHRDVALVCGHLGVLYTRLGNYPQGLACYEQALTLYRELNDIYGEATTLTNQGELFRMQDNTGQARVSFEKALWLISRLHDPLLESALRHNLGLLYYDEEHYGQALRCYLEALQALSHSKKHYNQGMILTNIGMLLFEQGQRAEGLAVLLAALSLRQSLHDPTSHSIELFFEALEQKMGHAPFSALRQSAQSIQGQVLSRLIMANMRQ